MKTTAQKERFNMDRFLIGDSSCLRLRLSIFQSAGERGEKPLYLRFFLRREAAGGVQLGAQAVVLRFKLFNAVEQLLVLLGERGAFRQRFRRRSAQRRNDRLHSVRPIFKPF